MMRRLVIMRHAKSSWNSGSATDHGRPLNRRGERTAPVMGAVLEERGWEPDLVLSSDALRASMTVEGVVRGFTEPPPVQFSPLLYHAGVDAVRRLLPEMDACIETVMLVGHNPGWEHLVAWLCDEQVAMKTADCALLTGEGDDWEHAVSEPGAWKLTQFLRAREFAG